MMNDNTKKTASSAFRYGLFALMLVAGGVAGLLVYRSRSGDDGGLGGKQDKKPGVGTAATAPRLAAEECLAAIQLKDISIGHLENGPGEVTVNGKAICGMEIAADGFAQLAETLPSERLPVQDLAIARLLLLRNAQDKVTDARDRAQAAAQRLIQFDDKSAIAYWIAARVELWPDPGNPLGLDDTMRAKAVAMLERATELDPDNPVFWYALSQATTKPREAEPSQAARQALGKAYALRPRNLFLITEWLLMQAKAKDSAIIESLKASRPVLVALAPGIDDSLASAPDPTQSPAAKTRRRGLNIGDAVVQALKAAEAGQWPAVTSRTFMIKNLIRPKEIQKSDITRINVHPLEYVLYDFSPEFHAVNARPEPAWSETTPVKLAIAADTRLPDLPDVRDVLLMDFNLNGLPDLCVLQPNKLRIFGRAKLSEPWSELAALDVPRGMVGILAADLDHDLRKSASPPVTTGNGESANARFNKVLSGTATCLEADPDIVVFGTSGVMVVRNDCETPDDQPKLVPIPNDRLGRLSDVSQGVMVDFDHDSDLDLIFSSRQGITLWEAGAKLNFRDVSQWSDLPPADVPVTSMVAVDWDRDVDIDVIMGEPSGKVVGYLENLRHGEFRWTPFKGAFQQLDDPARICVVEVDGNASWDLLAVGPSGVDLFLTATPTPGKVTCIKPVQVSDQAGAGILAWDFDNDGRRDAVTWGKDGLRLLRGGPKGTFAAAALVEPAVAEPVLAVDCADIDRDGDQDLVVATASRVLRIINEGGNANGWITIYPVGQKDNAGRCNHNAIGSLVELRSGGWYQAQVVAAPTVHFGLGKRASAEQIRIIWTNGVPQDLVEFGGNVAICEKMQLKGSCPYVYTMANGQFSFLTDCLWAAPIGMQTSAGTVAPTRSWEYLRIAGDRLTPHDGSYWVMLTEELWEAGYFDMVELIAIDHPADVEIHSNEKVGPAEIAEFKIHTVSKRRFPVAARDSQDADLREKLARRDGNFVRAFDQRIRQGLAPEHYIELDLGSLKDPKTITLFLTGWIYPTDTSLNIAFLQDPETDGPRMPSVWVPDESGAWKETIAYMGFPGGKTKTIAVDLSKAFLTDDYRVRIKTTAEIYWDEAFFTVDEPEVEVRQIPLALESADLQYRGFSKPMPYREDAPRMYDFDDVIRAPLWPPMRGKFTRYGSVTELVRHGDDMMAVLGAGDAMTVRFKVPQQDPPPGWKRDFFLHSIGWDKDADMNTLYGQTVGPLPFRGMKSYPFGADEAAPDSPEYHDYLQRYQTRQQNPRTFWRKLQRAKRL